MIPFHTGMRVTGREFCGRQQELTELREYMRSAGRVYLVGERRIGKTSLIFEAMRGLKGHTIIYVDLMAVKSVADVVQRLAAALIKTEKKQDKIMGLLKGLAHLQPSLSFDPLTNAPSVAFSPTGSNRPETLDSVFSLFASWPKTVVVFDEFQDILEVPAESALVARLRGLIQHLDQTGFVFCGSIRHSMEEIFTHCDSPFFNAAMRLHVGPLDRAKFRKYLARKFTAGDRRLEDGILDEIIEAGGDNPGAVQRFCTALWQATDRDQNDRARAFETFYGVYEASANTYAALYNGVLQRDWAQAQARNLIKALLQYS